MVLEWTYLQSCLNKVDGSNSSSKQCSKPIETKLIWQLLEMPLDKLWAFSDFYLFGFSHRVPATSSTSINQKKLPFRLRDLLMHYVLHHKYLLLSICLVCVIFFASSVSVTSSSSSSLLLWRSELLSFRYGFVLFYIAPNVYLLKTVVVQWYFSILWNSQLWFNIFLFVVFH